MSSEITDSHVYFSRHRIRVGVLLVLLGLGGLGLLVVFFLFVFFPRGFVLDHLSLFSVIIHFYSPRQIFISIIADIYKMLADYTRPASSPGTLVLHTRSTLLSTNNGIEDLNPKGLCPLFKYAKLFLSMAYSGWQER